MYSTEYATVIACLRQQRELGRRHRITKAIEITWSLELSLGVFSLLACSLEATERVAIRGKRLLMTMAAFECVVSIMAVVPREGTTVEVLREAV